MKTCRAYEADILEKLLNKHNKRILRDGEKKRAQRIRLKISEVWKSYESLNADIQQKEQIHEAVLHLETLGYITTDRKKFSDDIEKIYLVAAKQSEIEDYLEKEFGITARSQLVEAIRKLIKKYAKAGELTAFYCQSLESSLEQSMAKIDVEKERDLLRMLAFLQDNEEDLYVREASILVYGSSKRFEESYYEAVCNLIRRATGREKAEYEQNDEILRQYHVSRVGQEISLKGDFLIEQGPFQLETKYFEGGISLSSRDLEKIQRITLRTNHMMTIENKTSYERFAGKNCSAMYLGGYANRHQIELLKKIGRENPECRFWHFGDIDIGGFLIHQHLCLATGMAFRLFHMGVVELRDEGCKNALTELTKHDVARAENLRPNPAYQEVLEEMLKKKVKLEQEMVSYALMKRSDRTLF